MGCDGQEHREAPQPSPTPGEPGAQGKASPAEARTVLLRRRPDETDAAGTELRTCVSQGFDPSGFLVPPTDSTSGSEILKTVS